MKKYKIEIKATGAEATFGIVKEEETIEILKEKIEEEEIYTSMDINEDIYINSYDYTDLLHVYGPDINGATIKIEKCEDEECYDTEITIEETDINEIEEITIFTIENPYFQKENYEDIPEESILWGSYKEEKRIHLPAYVELEEEEEIETKNIFIGTVNCDETVADVEIVTDVFYIKEKEQEKILKENKEYETIEDMLDDYEETKEIFEQYKLEIGDIEGKGEYETDYNIILDIDGDVLYEGDNVYN